MITNHSYPPDKCTFELLSAYLDGEVTSEQREQVQALLNQDPDIQALYQRLLMLREGLQGLPQPAPQRNSQQLSNAVFAKIDRRKQQKRRWLLGGGAIAAVVVTTIGGIMNQNRLQLAQQDPKSEENSIASVQETTIAESQEELIIALNEPIIELPTESESLAELNRFCEAMISIRGEIDEANPADSNNVLKNAPHTLSMATSDEWDFPYSRQKAAFPLEYVGDNKFWPTVRRVDEAFGDRNLICTCAPMEAYAEV